MSFDSFIGVTSYKLGTESYSMKESVTASRHKLSLKALNETKYKYKMLPSRLFPMSQATLQKQVVTQQVSRL